MSQYPHGDPIEEARLLLPWYITGKLSEPERKLVEQMLAKHPTLQDEYQRELKMVGMIRANTGLLQLSAVDTTHHRLDKLMKRIGQEERAKITHAAPPPTRPSVWLGGITASLQRLLPTFEWLTPANAVFALLLLVQAGFMGWFIQSNQPPAGSLYTTAAVAKDQNAISATKGLVLLVDFHAEAQVHQVRDFLHQWNARIVDGPDDGNFFKIEVKGVQPSDQQQSSSILQQMQQDQTVIAFIGQESQY